MMDMVAEMMDMAEEYQEYLEFVQAHNQLDQLLCNTWSSCGAMETFVVSKKSNIKAWVDEIKMQWLNIKNAK